MALGIWAAPVLPGYLTDPSVVREKMGKGETYETPEAFRYPYVSTYYVKPTVTAGENVRIASGDS